MKDFGNTSRTGKFHWLGLLLIALMISTSIASAEKADDESAFWLFPPSLASLKRQIDNQIQRENFETVVELSTRAIKANPKYAVFYAKRAEAYVMLSKNDLAIADLTEAIRLQPRIGFPLIARGRIYDNQGKDDLALADYNHGIALGNWTGYKDQARILERKGQYDKAVVSLTKVLIKVQPLERIPFLFQRAKNYEKLGKKDLAKADKKLAEDLLNKSGGQNADRYTR